MAFFTVAGALLAHLSLTAREVATKRRCQDAHLDTALESMRQGLLMFDAQGRLVLYNRRFLELYRLPADAVKTGCTLSDLLRLRKAAGTFAGDPDQYVAKMVDADGSFKEIPTARLPGSSRAARSRARNSRCRMGASSRSPTNRHRAEAGSQFTRT